MEFLADLHIHSRFSRATSRDLDLPHLWATAQHKGLGVVGTGDFTHPAWFAELEAELVPAEEGLYRLKPELERDLQAQVLPSCRQDLRFLLSVEISTIYKQDGKTRKVHHLVLVPDLGAASRLAASLARIGNIASDGRPILGLSGRDLAQHVLDADPAALLIPAHVWTPWFSVLGAMGGFDSIEACYGDLAPTITALETGLSSDPRMNWRLSQLDRYTLVSNSDAHSPSKLGREANLFLCERTYPAMMQALRQPGKSGFGGTLEFFPEEGKYHLDGHRACGERLWPEQTRAQGGLCPGCGKPVTLGVMYRVEALADRPDGFRPPGAAPFRSLVGLDELLGEVLGVGPSSRRVQALRQHLLSALGPELTILQDVPVEELTRLAGPIVGEAMRRMRSGEVRIEGGYDGEYGVVRLFASDERRDLAGQGRLLPEAGPAAPRPRRPVRPSASVATPPKEPDPKPTPAPPSQGGKAEPRAVAETSPATTGQLGLRFSEPEDPLASLDSFQREAALHRGSPLVIVAGPGTGKTRTLTCRIARRLEDGVRPEQVLALTFTQKAAHELRERLSGLLPDDRGRRVQVFTFHALALGIVTDAYRHRGLPGPRVLTDEERLAQVAELLDQPPSSRDCAKALKALSLASLRDDSLPLLDHYRRRLEDHGAIDLDELVPRAVALLSDDPDLLRRWRERFVCHVVDEYQDVNAAQAALLGLLCPLGEDLCVIGDPDQAIYRFRGAEPRFFLEFPIRYPQARTVHLERGYRTPAALLEAAQALIHHDPTRPPSRTLSNLPGPPQVLVQACATAAAEAEQVVHSIERLIGGTTFFSHDSGRLDGHGPEAADALSFGDIAVLFRQGSQAEPLLEAFGRSSIPYQCPARHSPERILRPVMTLLSRAVASEAPSTVTSPPLDPEDLRLLAAVRALPPRQALTHLTEALLDEDHRTRGLQVVTTLAALLHGAGKTLADWAPLALGLFAGLVEADALERGAEAVTLCTLHAAKGLEFEVVFIVGCEEGLLPHRFGPDEPDPEAIREERRLLYVGMTRARRLLTLLWAGRRPIFGRSESRQPSRFLDEIPPDLKQIIRLGAASPAKKKKQLTLF